MQKNIYLDGNDFYLSKRYIKSYTSEKTIESWTEEMGVIKIKVENEIYFLYKSIPHRTRKKLLSPEKIISQETKKENYNKVSELLHQAYYFAYTGFKSFYEKEPSFTTSQITKFAQLHSVFNAIIELKKTESFRHLTSLHEAFNDLFPGKYKTKQAFSQTILKARVEGVVNVAMDKRTFGNNDRSKRLNTPQVDYIISALVACEGKFTNAVMLEKANDYFKEKGLKKMSLSWMKKQRRLWLKNPEIYKSRYGKNELQKIMPYASLKNANYTHIQWLIDGMTLPFWEDKFHRSLLVFVIDNCSKKIIGYAIGFTENSEVIKNAIRNAVDNTGVLPFELVMDNHSFTQTQSAFNFESLMNRLGATVTKTSNPRQKIIVERYIQNLNSLFKEYPGYLGKSIKSKSIEDVASDELKTEYAKQFKSHNEVIAITSVVIEDYNNKPQKGKSPIRVYDETQHPQPIQLSQFHKAQFLPNQILKKIDRGQINIMRGVEKFEYQLPAKLFQQWNNETVIVMHDELRDGIYLFDKSNGEGIAFLKQKSKINNSKALQTSEDIKLLNKNRGRHKGVENKARKQLEEIRDGALNIDDEAYLSVNAMTTPKSVIKELQQSSDKKYLAENNGVKINELYSSDKSFDMPLSLRPKKKDTNPFKTINNKLEIINPLSDDNN